MNKDFHKSLHDECIKDLESSLKNYKRFKSLPIYSNSLTHLGREKELLNSLISTLASFYSLRKQETKYSKSIYKRVEEVKAQSSYTLDELNYNFDIDSATKIKDILLEYYNKSK